MINSITDYIDTAKARSGAKSDRKLCDLMEVSPVWANNTRKGTLPTEKTMLKLAAIAGIPPHKALLDLNLWRSSGQAKMVYKQIADSLKGATLALLLMACFVPFPAQAKCNLVGAHNIYYGK